MHHGTSKYDSKNAGEANRSAPQLGDTVARASEPFPKLLTQV